MFALPLLKQRRRPRWVAALALVIVAFAMLVACDVDMAPEGTRKTPDGTGPVVVFDLRRQPMPEIPLPNDVATFADPTSRTGRRVNFSLVAPTRLEAALRAGADAMEGWGTFSPITVSFTKPAALGELATAIAIDDVAARTRDYDPADDPFYVVDLTTGVPVPLDVGKGNFPLALVRRDGSSPSNPHGAEDTLLFETLEEGPTTPQSGVTPAIDKDFDGVVDHPNVLDLPLSPAGRSARVDEVIDWYERETDTLILRPVVPLDERHEYAVVLTDRLRGVDGAPVRSPFEFIHHIDQADGAERVGQILGDGSKRAWFGDIAGTGLDHVAFVWTFTTQPVVEDLRVLRDGLYGRGAFAALAGEFPAGGQALRAVGVTANDTAPPATPACTPRTNTPLVVKAADTKDAFADLLRRALGTSANAVADGDLVSRLLLDLDVVDHFVIGTFDSPYFLGDPASEDPNASFSVDYRSGKTPVSHDAVTFWLAVPKANGAAKAPFPVAVWNHGAALGADELLSRAADFAKQGVALMGIGVPGQGLAPDPAFVAAAQNVFPPACLAPWVSALSAGHHTAIGGAPLPAPPATGPALWTVSALHTRDLIRQGVVQELQATRVVRSWDGQRRSGAGLAGDFDGDGVVDVGGPTATVTTTGDGYGGAVAMIAGSLDPNVGAAAPISGGGGLSDVGFRAALTPDSAIQQALGPLLIGVPASLVPKIGDAAQTRCADPQRSVRLVLNDSVQAHEVEIACLTPAELDVGKTLVLENVTTHERRCTRTGDAGRFRVPIPATAGDRLDVQIYNAADSVDSYATCNPLPGAPAGRRVQTFEQAVAAPPSAADAKQCQDTATAFDFDPAAGCQSYEGQAFPVGSPLASPADGLGIDEQSPPLRRLLNLTQAVLDPADPVSFAPYYGLRPEIGPTGATLPPRGLLAASTAGDAVVPTAAGYAFARAAGLVPFLPPVFADTLGAWAEYVTPLPLWDQLGGQTPNDVLVRGSVLEGAARLGRTAAGPSCTPNYVASAACIAPPPPSECAEALFDADWLSEGKDPWDAPHPAVPLRLARAIDLRATDSASLGLSWQPRQVGAPFTPDAAAWAPTRPLGAVVNAWLEPLGQHAFAATDPCKKFDDDRYYDALLVRFLASAGKDLYFLTHPSTHLCLEQETCPFFP